MTQPHPPVTPALWPVAPPPSFARPRPAPPKPQVKARSPKAKA